MAKKTSERKDEELQNKIFIIESVVRFIHKRLYETKKIEGVYSFKDVSDLLSHFAKLLMEFDGKVIDENNNFCIRICMMDKYSNTEDENMKNEIRLTEKDLFIICYKISSLAQEVSPKSGIKFNKTITKSDKEIILYLQSNISNGEKEKNAKDEMSKNKFYKINFEKDKDFKVVELDFIKAEKKEMKKGIDPLAMLLFHGKKDIPMPIMIKLLKGEELSSEDIMFTSMLSDMKNKTNEKGSVFIPNKKCEEISEEEKCKVECSGCDYNEENVDVIVCTEFDQWFGGPESDDSNSIVDWITKGITMKKEFEKEFNKTILTQIQKLR